MRETSFKTQSLLWTLLPEQNNYWTRDFNRYHTSSQFTLQFLLLRGSQGRRENLDSNNINNKRYYYSCVFKAENVTVWRLFYTAIFTSFPVTGEKESPEESPEQVHQSLTWTVYEVAGLHSSSSVSCLSTTVSNTFGKMRREEQSFVRVNEFQGNWEKESPLGLKDKEKERRKLSFIHDDINDALHPNDDQVSE